MSLEMSINEELISEIENIFKSRTELGGWIHITKHKPDPNVHDNIDYVNGVTVHTAVFFNEEGIWKSWDKTQGLKLDEDVMFWRYRLGHDELLEMHKKIMGW